jgi:single-stranded-DNA-specific exonuclease
VFIGTYEDAAKTHIRGSARSIPEFNVFDALEFCKDLMLKHGGHKAAGGFSFAAAHLDQMRARLRTFAHRSLKPEHLKPLVTIDAQADLTQLDLALHAQLDALHPCGMENPDPIFWTPNVCINDQRRIGKGHIKFTVQSGTQKINAIAWRWGEYFPLPNTLDIAYRLKSNEWNNQVSVQLEVIGVRLPQSEAIETEFVFSDRSYTCRLLEQNEIKELRIQNTKGETLVIQKGQKIGTLGKINQRMQEVDVTQAPYYDLVKAAVTALKN